MPEDDAIRSLFIRWTYHKRWPIEQPRYEAIRVGGVTVTAIRCPLEQSRFYESDRRDVRRVTLAPFCAGAYLNARRDIVKQ